MAKEVPLDRLRREIDLIDDQIHDLLMRRTDIVGKIGALKRQSETGAPALRPGREAEIVRRLIARHRGPFPKEVLVRIWRELLSAQVAVQTDFTVAVFAPEGIGIYRELARDQFGSCTPLRRYYQVSQIVQDVWNGNVSIGILPMPMGERSDPWWRALVVNGRDVPRIITRLPFYESESAGGDLPSALAIGMIEPEATGEDVSVVAIERVADISRDHLREDLAASGLAAKWLGAWQDADAPGHAMYVVSVDGFLRHDEPRLEAFRARVGEAVGLAVILGAYPRPIRGDARREQA